MQSFIKRTRTFLTPSGSSANLAAAGSFRTEKTVTALFPQTDPAVDGDDCLHDCASCVETLPRKWSIDEDDALYGEVKGWQTHLVIGTGKRDWVRDVTDEKGSLMQAVGKVGLELGNGKVMLSASDLPSGHCSMASEWETTTVGKEEEEYPDGGRTRCLVLPRWEWVEGVGTDEAKWLLEEVVGKGITNETPLSDDTSKPKRVSLEKDRDGEFVVQKEEEVEKVTTDVPDMTELSIQEKQPNGDSNSQPVDAQKPPVGISNALKPADVTIKPCQHRAIILMCSHGTRDWRCGKSAPILRREFERHLRPLGLYRDFSDDRPGGVGIYFINHVGGHKYSANVMIYRREGQKKEDAKEETLRDEAVQGIWLARVRPEDCENIVKYTVLQGKLVKPQRQLRGGFDRERGVLSW
ncbi:hypothetical protein H2198_006906 [Neophaeococcomyces mojaviensis]|uniref:Uncharacterized protein n=1 Tax=Neophaeococcomyces mojaviensis TaxID=3383035 RepID=A0ACC3A1Y4_9EURO|nr:hypothetical protein H2198_006906 [Knufia sp. JES_112]